MAKDLVKFLSLSFVLINTVASALFINKIYNTTRMKKFILVCHLWPIFRLNSLSL